MTQTAARALDLMTAVVRSHEPQGLMGLVEATGIDKSTASRLLGLLAERGFVAREDRSKRYQVGPELMGMLLKLSARLDVREASAPYLARLRETYGETVSLHIRLGHRRVCVDGAESNHAVRRVLPLGDSLPLYQGPSGKVILAHLAPDEAEPVLRDAECAGIDIGALRAQLAAIREAGFVLTVGDRTPGVRAASACVLGPHGPFASITIAGPADRWTVDAGLAAVPELLGAALEVSLKMGGRPR